MDLPTQCSENQIPKHRTQGQYFQCDIPSSLKACSTTETDCKTLVNWCLGDKTLLS